MSDTSYIMGRVFEMIAEEIPEARRKTVARKFWKMAGEIDFSDDEMECDKALIKLGLAKMAIDPNYPEDGLGVVYRR